jgi:hypothetical protein
MHSVILSSEVLMKSIKVLKTGRYEIVQFENGCFGLIDRSLNGMQTVAAGYSDLAKLEVWADRLNLRHVWGK